MRNEQIPSLCVSLSSSLAECAGVLLAPPSSDQRRALRQRQHRRSVLGDRCVMSKLTASVCNEQTPWLNVQVCDEPHPVLIKDMLQHCVNGSINETY